MGATGNTVREAFGPVRRAVHVQREGTRKIEGLQHKYTCEQKKFKNKSATRVCHYTAAISLPQIDTNRTGWLTIVPSVSIKR